MSDITPRLVWATTATHLLGDISRPDGDFAWVEREDEDSYRGHWETGFGFVNVKFPKSATRELSWVESEWRSRRTVVID